MFGIFDKIEEFFQELLLGGIQANLESMFIDINDKVGAIATDIGKTPMDDNGKEYSNVRVLSSKLLKAKEQLRNQVGDKDSVLDAIKKYKTAEQIKPSDKKETSKEAER